MRDARARTRKQKVCQHEAARNLLRVHAGARAHAELGCTPRDPFREYIFALQKFPVRFQGPHHALSPSITFCYRALENILKYHLRASVAPIKLGT